MGMADILIMTDKAIYEKMRNDAISASKHAHSPYSKIKVGSSVLTENGEYFSGCNVENCSLGATVCAERVAMWNAISEGQIKFLKIYIYTDEGWPPCGLCRQVMLEFADKNLELIIGDKKGNEQVLTFRDLFPLPFKIEF